MGTPELKALGVSFLNDLGIEHMYFVRDDETFSISEEVALRYIDRKEFDRRKVLENNL